MSGLPEDVSEDEARKALERVLASAGFASSERHRRFLGYVVEETLAGRADRIKAYSIAVSAFGRGADFDAQQDSIVRIEAGRLRRALEHYYLTEGRADGVHITMPKGAYVPQFSRANPKRAPNAAPPAPIVKGPLSRRGFRIRVTSFEVEATIEGMPDFGRGFARHIIMGLTRFGNIEVYGVDATCCEDNQGTAPEVSSEPVVDFVLTGTVSVTSDRLSVEALLMEAPSGRFIWTDRFERNLVPADICNLRDQIADAVAGSLAQPYGILFSRADDHEGKAPDTLGSFRAVLDFYRYLRDFRRDMFEPVRIGLEMAIQADPAYAEAYACLSQIYTNAARFGLDVGHVTHDPLGRARKLADKAIRLAPNSSAAHHALALVLWFSGDPDGSMDAYRKASSLNPNDSDLMADFGLRYCLLMDWPRGVPLIENSFARNPCQPAPFRVGLFLYHFAEGRYDVALKQARMIEAQDVVYGHLCLAAAAAASGQMTEARKAIDAIERAAPGFGRRLRSDLAARNLHPELIDLLSEALDRAGLFGLATEVKPKSQQA